MAKVKRKSAGRRITKGVIGVIAVCVTATVFLAAVLITNAFIPVKYFSAYCVKGRDNQAGTMRVSFIDVGFGDSALIELPDGKTALIDGGDGSYANQLHLLRFLNSKSVSIIDYLICTSVKNEHCGGLAEILKYKKVGRAYIPYCKNTRITDGYYAFTAQLVKQNIPVSYACMGEDVCGENYFLTFLAPYNYQNPLGAYSELNKNPTSANMENASAVVWLKYGDTAFAFTSDIRADGLKRILTEYENAKAVGKPFCSVGNFSVRLEDCKVVTAPAHAGAGNTYAPWYDIIKPEQTVVSVGKNFSDYPSRKALSDISAYCNPLITSENGDLIFTVGVNGYAVN